MTTKDYDGPGEYEVDIHLSGTATITVRADSMAEAERKAEREADSMDYDFSAEATDAKCISPDPTYGDSSCDSLERLAGLEMAVWAFTGKVPPEAMRRIQQEDAMLVAAGEQS